jgi:hypothetical protein
MGNSAFKKFKFRALQKICLYFYDVECTVEMPEKRLVQHRYFYR